MPGEASRGALVDGIGDDLGEAATSGSGNVHDADEVGEFARLGHEVAQDAPGALEEGGIEGGIRVVGEVGGKAGATSVRVDAAHGFGRMGEGDGLGKEKVAMGLTKVGEETGAATIAALRRRRSPLACEPGEGEVRYLVTFRVDQVRPLIGD